MKLTTFLYSRHNTGEQHIQLHDMAVVGFSAQVDEASMWMSFTNVWMLLNYFRALNSAWPIQVMGDGTFNFSDRVIALLGLGVMTPGGKLHPLIFSYVPTESAEGYKFAWTTFERTAISFCSKFMACEEPSCAICSAILTVLKDENTVEVSGTPAFSRQKRLMVDRATSDNSAAFTKFAVESMGISPMKCAAHLTGVSLYSRFLFSPRCALLTVRVQLFRNRKNFTRGSLGTKITTRNSTVISFSPVTARSRNCVGCYLTRFAPRWSC